MSYNRDVSNDLVYDSTTGEYRAVHTGAIYYAISSPAVSTGITPTITAGTNVTSVTGPTSDGTGWEGIVVVSDIDDFSFTIQAMNYNARIITQDSITNWTDAAEGAGVDKFTLYEVALLSIPDHLYGWRYMDVPTSTVVPVYSSVATLSAGMNLYSSTGISLNKVAAYVNGYSFQAINKTYSENQILYTSPEVAASNDQSTNVDTLNLQVPGKYRLDIVGGGGGGALVFYNEGDPHWAADGGVGGTMSVYLTIQNPLTLTLTTGSGAYARYGRQATTTATAISAYNGAASSITASTGLSLVANGGTPGTVSGNGAANAPGTMGGCTVSGSTSAAAVQTISINPNTIYSTTENRAVTSGSDPNVYRVPNTNWSANTMYGAGGGCCYTTRNTILNATGGQGFIKVTFINYV